MQFCSRSGSIYSERDGELFKQKNGNEISLGKDWAYVSNEVISSYLIFVDKERCLEISYVKDLIDEAKDSGFKEIGGRIVFFKKVEDLEGKLKFESSKTITEIK